MSSLIHAKRKSGILAHITSLPSPFGIGDIGPGAYTFIDFLASAKQSIWQFLPLGVTDGAFSNSPYMSLSAFAGNPLIISPELLVNQGLLTSKDLDDTPDYSQYTVDFSTVSHHKSRLLSQAYTQFRKNKPADYEAFCNEREWLNDYTLFRVLKKKYAGQSWYMWDSSLRDREISALQTIINCHKEEIDYYSFEQFIFFQQWRTLRSYSRGNNIELFGDIPIYVSLDSADVWANQEIFQLHPRSKKPRNVAGVPPDYFSDTGQKWGNPLYSWDNDSSDIQSKLIQWWTSRFRSVYELVDIARIDHFRAFESYFAIPAEHKTAVNGEWVKGPGKPFFDSIFEKLGPINIVAEDLGEITPEVYALRDELDFPGMKVLQFAFDGNKKNTFLPWNFENSNCYVYTGTHDNDTTVGWYLDTRLNDHDRERIKTSANGQLHDNSAIHEDLIYLAMSSIASTCIFPLQDILGFGSDCRMNTPGQPDGNWSWRCSSEFLTNDKAGWLASLTEKFNRNVSSNFEKIKSLDGYTTLS